MQSGGAKGLHRAADMTSSGFATFDLWMSRRGMTTTMAAWALLYVTPGWSSMNTNTPAAPTFALKAPEHYFADARALALLRAALAGDAAQAKAAVAAGAPLDEEGPRSKPDNRLRLLHYTVAADNAAAARLLTELGADPELNTAGFGPAMLFAITLDKPILLGAMLDARSFTRLAPATQEMLMFDAVSQNRPRCIKLLLDRGAPIDLRDTAGYTILMRAIGALDPPLAIQLLAQGASLKVEAVGGATPANLVQLLLLRATADSPLYGDLQKLKSDMQAKGVVFPVPTAREVRAARPRP